MRQVSKILASAVAAIAISGAAQAQITMKASHQFPGGKGDVRDDMVQMIGKEMKAANVGVDVQVYPGASLFKLNDHQAASCYLYDENPSITPERLSEMLPV